MAIFISCTSLSSTGTKQYGSYNIFELRQVVNLHAEIASKMRRTIEVIFRHLLVSFLFHALTSLHPPSFHRNDFSTCSTHFSFILVKSPKMFSLRSAHVDFMHAHAHAENLHVHAHVNGVVQCQPWKSPTIYHRNVRREKNERSVSVHTSVDCGDVW